MKQSPLPKVLFLDVNETLLDIQVFLTELGAFLGGTRSEGQAWFKSLLHYSLVHNTIEDFKPLGEIALATLEMQSRAQNLDFNSEKAQSIISSLAQAPPHPDVIDGLKKLQAAGFLLYAISNSSKKLLGPQIHQSGLAPFLEGFWSVEEIKVYKPHAQVYQWVLREAKVQASEAGMVAAHPWDLMGAFQVGIPGYFIQRNGQTMYPPRSQDFLVYTDFKALSQALTGS